MYITGLLVIFFGTCPSIALFKQIEDEFTRTIFWPSVVQIHSDDDGFASKGNYTMHRSIRKASACKIPKGFNDSYVECKIYPTRTRCHQLCAFGFTLKEGILREMRCNHDENRWLPVPEFEFCRPFVDCTLTVGPGGKYRCRTNYLDEGPHCQVSCKRYEDMPAVSPKRYDCDINGKWTPKLPFCAKAGTGMKLVPPPVGQKVAKRGKKGGIVHYDLGHGN